MSRETIDFVVVDDLPTLVWLANLAALELHTPQWRVGADPDLLVVDLDPGAPAGLRECCAVAVLMRDRLAEDGVAAYPKTSGKKGMQLCCPISGTQGAEVVSGYAEADRRGAGGDGARARSPRRWPRRCGPGRSSSTGARTTRRRPR